MPRKTDASNPADWLWISASDLAGLRSLAASELSHEMCRGKLAEVLEKIIKAELIRLGWTLVKTHDLIFLSKELQARQSDLAAEARRLSTLLADAYLLDGYPGFDLNDPDWPAVRAQVEQVAALLAAVQARVAGPDAPAP